jgi:hypothetical protein
VLTQKYSWFEAFFRQAFSAVTQNAENSREISRKKTKKQRASWLGSGVNSFNGWLY